MRSFLLLGLLFISINVYSEIIFVRTSAITEALSVTIVEPAIGNALVLAVGGNLAGGSVSTVSGGGVTWSKVIGTSINRLSEIWCGPASSGVGTTVTMTVSGTDTNQMTVSEWSGMDCTVVSSATAGSASNATITSGNAVVVDPGSMIYAVVRWGGGQTYVSGPSASFTSLGRIITRSDSGYLLPNAVGTYSTVWTVTLAVPWDIQIAEFRSTGMRSAMTNNPLVY